MTSWLTSFSDREKYFISSIRLLINGANEEMTKQITRKVMSVFLSKIFIFARRTEPK